MSKDVPSQPQLARPPDMSELRSLRTATRQHGGLWPGIASMCHGQQRLRAGLEKAGNPWLRVHGSVFAVVDPLSMLSTTAARVSRAMQQQAWTEGADGADLKSVMQLLVHLP